MNIHCLTCILLVFIGGCTAAADSDICKDNAVASSEETDYGSEGSSKPDWFSAEVRPNDEQLGENATRVVPYVVSLQEREAGSHFCGGAIISALHVISAAHCFNDRQPEGIRVMVGSLSVFGRDIHHVERIIVHPKYSEAKHKNNIAVLVVNPRFKFKKGTVQPIELGCGATRDLRVNHPGWGRIQHEPEIYPESLQIYRSRTITNKQCSRYYKTISKSLMCISGKTVACLGDPGGPLVTVSKRTPLLVGINAMLKNGCPKKRPQVFTKISSFLDFIRRSMKES